MWNYLKIKKCQNRTKTSKTPPPQPFDALEDHAATRLVKVPHFRCHCQWEGGVLCGRRAPLYGSEPFQDCAALVGCPGLGHIREPRTQGKLAPRPQKSHHLVETILAITCYSKESCPFFCSVEVLPGYRGQNWTKTPCHRRPIQMEVTNAIRPCYSNLLTNTPVSVEWGATAYEVQSCCIRNLSAK